MQINIRFPKLTFNEVKFKEHSKKNKQILDEQLEKLPKKVIFCKKCVTSNQRPRTEFDDKGVCNACRYAEKKFGGFIDWNKREKEFSELGWGSFNARFRDVLRGDLHNYDEKGFLFGNFRDSESLKNLQSLILGTPNIYQSSAHAVNFLEVHDDYCFNDYLRLSSGRNSKDDIIQDPMKHIELDDDLLRKNKLGALILLTSQGIPIIHQGQDWAHSQIIAETDAHDPNVGKMDRNPYNKDNETNWVNWLEKEQNKELADYYSGLIDLRRTHTEFRHATKKDFKFQGLADHALGYVIRDRIAVYINGENSTAVETDLPEGKWQLIVNNEEVNLNGMLTVSGEITIPPTSGLILKRVN